MSHEHHHGDCCEEHHQHADTNHIHELAGKLGSMCCQGQCLHPEHQSLHDSTLHSHLLGELDGYEELDFSGTKKKKKKRSLLGAIMAQATS